MNCSTPGLPVLSPTTGVHSNSHPSSRWCHPAISSSVIPFSSCPQSLPASESFPMSQFFTWGGPSTGVSALASFLPKNSQDWSPFFAAAKSLQSCPTLCDPIDGSPPGSPVPGILQARTLEWVAISFSNAWKWKMKVKSPSRVQLSATPWTAAYQAPPSMGVSRQEYWSGVPLPSPFLYTSNFKNVSFQHYATIWWPTKNVVTPFLKEYSPMLSLITLLHSRCPGDVSQTSPHIAPCCL